MATAKNEVFIGLYHENCNLVGDMPLILGIEIWWKESIRRTFPAGGRMHKFSASRGIPLFPQQEKSIISLTK